MTDHETPTGAGDEAHVTETDLERRLRSDEERLARDERRLEADEQRLAQEERWIHRSWRLELALLSLLGLVATALFIGIFALNRDIEAVARATPKDNSVGTSAMKDGAVTSGKLADRAVTRAKMAPAAVTGGAIAPGAVGASALAPGSVGRPALAAGAVGPQKLADDAVTSRSVAPDSLTAADIDETTLTAVGRARTAGTAATAANATALGGVAAGDYVSRVTLVRAASGASTLRTKGPISATCPSGLRVVAGGASIDGAARGVALTTSAPDGDRAWIAEAAAAEQPSSPWRLVVTAICARGG